MRRALPNIAQMIAVMAGMVLAPLWGFCAFFLWTFADPSSADLFAALELMVVSAAAVPLATGEFSSRRLQFRVGIISLAGIEHAGIQFLPSLTDSSGFLFGCLIVASTAATVIFAAIGGLSEITRQNLGKTVR
jgi:putative flippase GtrA